MPSVAQQVIIKFIKISPDASTNIKVGQILLVSNSPFKITVTAADGSIKEYSLNINQDEGIQVEPNSNIESGSSYILQSSDVYVDGAQLTPNFNRFYQSAYADFNNDGNTDVLLASGIFKSHEYSPIFLYLGDGTGVNSNFCECGGECSGYNCDSFTLVPNALPESYEGLQHPRKILTGDYNGDNFIDAFIIGHGYDASPFPGESPFFFLIMEMVLILTSLMILQAFSTVVLLQILITMAISIFF